MNTRIFVGGISFGMDSGAFETALRSDPLGLAPRNVKLVTDRETGASRGFAFVDFDTEQAADEAMKMLDGYMLEGRSLRAEWAEQKPRGQGTGHRGGREDGGQRGRR